jgi:YVTN family beta-propeller protein
LSPLYHGELLVHGLGFSPDHKTLAVVSIGSNSITLIDTETSTIQGKIYVGRSPHEAFFRPNGREIWAAVRGENYVSVIDPKLRKEVRRIETANGPGMILFRPDGRYAFVPSSFTPEMDVIDTATYQVIARVKQESPFSPNLAVDQDEVWFTLKDSGKTQIVSAQPPFRPLAAQYSVHVDGDAVRLEDAGRHERWAVPRAAGKPLGRNRSTAMARNTRSIWNCATCAAQLPSREGHRHMVPLDRNAADDV